MEAIRQHIRRIHQQGAVHRVIHGVTLQGHKDQHRCADHQSGNHDLQVTACLLFRPVHEGTYQKHHQQGQQEAYQHILGGVGTQPQPGEGHKQGNQNAGNPHPAVLFLQPLSRPAEEGSSRRGVAAGERVPGCSGSSLGCYLHPAILNPGAIDAGNILGQLIDHVAAVEDHEHFCSGLLVDAPVDHGAEDHRQHAGQRIREKSEYIRHPGCCAFPQLLHEKQDIDIHNIVLSRVMVLL